MRTHHRQRALPTFLKSLLAVGFAFGSLCITTFAQPSAPTITTDISPPLLQVPPGYVVTYSVAAAGSPLNYQWYSNSTAIDDATNSSYSFSAAVGSNSYSCIVSNSLGTAPTSTAAVVASTVAPVVTFNGFTNWSVQGTGNQIVDDNSIWLTAGGTSENSSAFCMTPQYIEGFTASFIYYPYLGTHIPQSGASTARADGLCFVLQNTAAGPAVLGGGGGSLGYATQITNSAALQFNIYPSSADGGIGMAFNVGGKVPTTSGGNPFTTTGNVDVDAADPIAVTIYYNYASNLMTVNLMDQSNYATFTTNVTVGNLTNVVQNAANPGIAYVGFTGATGGSASVQQISDFTYSYSLPGQPVITQVQPSNVNTNRGSSVSFTATATGSGVSYQWYDINGNPLTTNATLTLADVQTNQAGTYTVVASNSVGAASASAILAVSSGAPTVISDVAPTTINLYQGKSVTLSFGVSGDAPNYTWSLNGTPIPGATGASYTFEVQNGVKTYACEAANGVNGGSIAYSSPATVTGVPTPTDTYGKTVLADSPISYWRLNDPANSSSAYDYVGGNNGTVNGSVTFGAPQSSDGGLGGCAAFNSSGEGRIDVPYNTNLNTSEFTVEAWVYVNATTGTYQSPITCRNTGNGDLGYIFYLNPSQDWSYWFGGINAAGFNEITYSTAATLDAWTHLVGTWDGAIMRFYINGTQIGASTPTDNPKTVTPGMSEPLSIGAGGSELAAGEYYLDGSMDEVAYYDYALSQAQVLAHYQAAIDSPNITQEPTNAITINAGANLALTSSATGYAPLSYQWLSNNVALAGQTNATLDLSDVQSSLSGVTLTLVVSNSYGNAQSPGTFITVLSGPPYLVTNLQPAQLVLYQGESETYSVTAQGNVPFYYQWTENSANIPGATSSSYTATTASGTNIYSVNVSNNYNGGSITPGSTGTLISQAPPTAPYPVKVLADHPIAFWRLDEPNGSSIANDYVGGHDGAYSQTLLGVPGYSPLDLDIAAEFGPLAGYSADSYMQETDNSSLGIPLIDFAQPQGQNAEFSIEAWVNGPSGQDTSGSAIIAKGNSGSDEFVLDASAPGGKFRFYIREAGGSVPSIYSPVGPDGNWHHLVGVCDEANGSMYLYVDGAINGTITGLGGLGLEESTVPVSVGAQFNLGDFSYQFNGTIDEVSVYNYALTPAQVQAHYTAAPEPPYFTVQPSTNITGYIGEKLTLAASVLGSMPLTNQWFVNGTPIAGQTNLYLILANLPSGTNTYVLAVSNEYGFTNSAPAIVQVPAGSGPPQLLADIEPLSPTIFIGQSVTFSVSATGLAPLDYQWWFDNSAITGATNESYTIPNVTSNDAGTYYCVISNSVSTVNSSTATLAVQPLPANPYSLTIIADHPVAYYRLDETNGSAIGYDYVGGNNGIYSNTSEIFHIPGAFGSLYDEDTAAYFGTNDDLNTFLGGTITNVDFAVPNGGNGAFSVEAWAKGLPGVNQTSGGAIVAKGVGNGDEQFAMDAHSGFRFYVRNALSATSVAGAQSASTVGGSIVSGNWQMDGNWHHVVGVCDQANNNILLYVDGSLVGPNIITNGVVPPLAIAKDMGHNGSTGTNGEIFAGEGIHEPADIGPAYWYANSVSIGARNNNSGSAGNTLNFQGGVDEVALYNYVLSPLQVSNHFAVAKDVPVPLVLQFTNGQPVLTWSGAWISSTLQSTTNLSGPWTTVPGATSPYLVPTTAPAQFYRVKLF
ncbi:MAG TPA: LamG-like jellyroll fold domain-containing protein [Verrucomicrobiae bacterium]|nr:LamG-like jellyroll fold domain-containing protein [Verrucomicrobiae bacterium]